MSAGLRCQSQSAGPLLLDQYSSVLHLSLARRLAASSVDIHWD